MISDDVSTTADDAVARYYDRNTLRFLVFGGGARALSIHRELWGPGVETAEDAKRFVNRLLARQLAAMDAESASVLDLGCGVGGTIFHLAETDVTARLHGVTISGRQQRLARAFARRRGLTARCTVHLADFERMELDLAADLAVAVESFAHARSAARFLRTAAAHLRPGGRLVIVDDFLAREESRLTPAERRIIGLLRRGWRLGNLTTVAACVSSAREADLVPADEVDLTPLVRPGRPRDAVIALLGPLFERLGLIGVPFFGNMIGGDALQTGLRTGLVEYRMLAFDRV